jgi:signal transduction histidine kinase
MFPPLNLVEGWVGLPLNFRVHRDTKTIGYVAPILSFKTIINDIYEDTGNEEFVYHFSTQEGYDFDRERTYNNTRVYNLKEDPEFYKNFEVNPSQFLYTTNTYYGFDITIGTAYKKAYAGNKSFNSLLIFWFLTISFMALIVTWQLHQFRKLNSKLLSINKLLRQNKKIIDKKNVQLQKLNDTQTKFFSIIGHDLKQPLNAIEGLVSLLQYEEIKDPELAEIIKNLSKSTKNTTILLNNLLRWARSQTGDIKFIPTQLNLNSILEEVVETLYFQAKEKSIKIIYLPQKELLYRGDRDMLSTIFRNLVSNSIKFSNLGGVINIDTRKRNNSIEISIKDSGIGMTPEEVNSLFKLNSQISTVGTSGEMGTGLGLILCHIFTKNHKGKILIDSEVDKGSRFTVVLPIQ